MWNTCKRLLQYAKRYRLTMVLAVVTALGGGVLSLLVPVYIGKGIDTMTDQGVDFPALAPILGVLCAATAGSALLQWAMQICTNRLSYRTIRDIRVALFDHLNAVPLSYLDAKPRGELIQTAVNDVELISDGLMQGAVQLLSGVVSILGTLAFMLSINAKIAAIVVVLMPLSLLVAGRIAAYSHSAFAAQSALRGELTGFAEEEITNQKLTQAFGYEERAQDRFEVLNQKLCKAGIRATFLSAMINPTTRFLNGILYAVVGTVGVLSAMGAVDFIGVITVGQLTSFLAYANQYTKPFNEISGVIAELQNAVASAGRVFAVMDAEAEPSDAQLPALVHCDGSMELRNVSFSYRPDTTLLQNLNLNVAAGQKIAVVGPTGCGKTTLINLLLRFYEPQSGTISLSGQDISEVTRSSLRGAYGMVLQDTWIFTGTVAENIAYGKPDATREEILAAAKTARAHKFIERLPQGYDTLLGEDCALSQGQKQLLSIARIMLTDPPILILDEATSSLDIRTEQYVRRGFDKLMEGKTGILIAHRLSTIRNADRILVMKAGNIIEQGTHDELLLQGGFYAELYASQFADSQAK